MTGQLSISALGALILAVAAVVIGGLQLFLSQTRAGAIMRATAQDVSAAELVGIDARSVSARATAIAVTIGGLAGLFIAIRSTFAPTSGPDQLIFAFEAVVIGGLGSLWGTLIGGIVLGVAQTVGAQINPQHSVLAGHIVFLAVLVTRRRGLLAARGAVAWRPAGVGRGCPPAAPPRQPLDAALACRRRRLGGVRRRDGVRPRQPQLEQHPAADQPADPGHPGGHVERADRLRRSDLDRPAGVRRAGRVADFSLETTASPEVLRQAVDCTAPVGVCGLIGVAALGTEVSPDMHTLLAGGRTIRGIVEGDSIPSVFLPVLMALWEQRRFPVERMIEYYGFDQIDQAVAAAESGGVVKAVLRMR